MRPRRGALSPVALSPCMGDENKISLLRFQVQNKVAIVFVKGQMSDIFYEARRGGLVLVDLPVRETRFPVVSLGQTLFALFAVYLWRDLQAEGGGCRHIKAEVVFTKVVSSTRCCTCVVRLTALREILHTHKGTSRLSDSLTLRLSGP